MQKMLILRWIQGFSGHTRMVEDLSNRIAARSERAVWARTYPLVATMDPAQASGYIRARSTQVIARELQIAMSQRAPLPTELIDEVKRAVSERLVRKTLSEVATHRPPRLAELRAA
jgi:hypothetical protein